MNTTPLPTTPNLNTTMTTTNKPCLTSYLATHGTVDGWSAYLEACVAEHGQELAVDDLSRDQIKIVRRLQAGLTAKPVAAPEPAPARPRRRIVRRSAPSLRCGCINCRTGRESLCLHD